MDKIRRRTRRIFHRPASLTSGEIGQESSIQASTSANTEPQSQNTGEVATETAESLETQALRAREARERLFDAENWRDMDAADFKVHASGWPSDSRTPTVLTGHAARSLEPESAASSAATSNAAPTENQEKKATAEDQAEVAPPTKVATPDMEDILAELIANLYIWAGGERDPAVLNWFEKTQPTLYRQALFQVPTPGRKGLTRLFPFVPEDPALPVRKNESHLVAGYELQELPWGEPTIPSAGGPIEHWDYVCSDEAYTIYRPGRYKILCLKLLRVRPTGLQLVFTLV